MAWKRIVRGDAMRCETQELRAARTRTFVSDTSGGARAVAARDMLSTAGFGDTSSQGVTD
jgi:hypothetical protein